MVTNKTLLVDFFFNRSVNTIQGDDGCRRYLALASSSTQLSKLIPTKYIYTTIDGDAHSVP